VEVVADARARARALRRGGGATVGCGQSGCVKPRRGAEFFFRCRGALDLGSGGSRAVEVDWINKQSCNLKRLLLGRRLGRAALTAQSAPDDLLIAVFGPGADQV
jgi:hypothetical protein